MEKINQKYIEKRRKEMRRKKIVRMKMAKASKVMVAGIIGVTVVTGVGSKMIETHRWVKENPRAYTWLLQNKVELITKKDRELAERIIAEQVEAEMKREAILNKYATKVVSE